MIRIDILCEIYLLGKHGEKLKSKKYYSFNELLEDIREMFEKDIPLSITIYQNNIDYEFFIGYIEDLGLPSKCHIQVKTSKSTTHQL